MENKRKFLLGLGSAVAMMTAGVSSATESGPSSEVQPKHDDQQSIVRHVMDLLMLSSPQGDEGEKVSGHSSHASHGSHGSHGSHSSHSSGS